MNDLSVMFNIKKDIISQLIKDVDVVNVLNHYNNPKVFAADLIYHQIFPYFYIPMSDVDNKTTTEAKPFISMRTFVPRFNGNALENFGLQVAIFSHKTSMTYNQYVITDYLLDKVNKVVLDMETLGIDGAEIQSIEPYPNQLPAFDGYIVTYKIDIISKRCEY